MDTKTPKETNWTTTLRTAYQYSLNVKISDDIKSTNNEIVDLDFPSLKGMYGRMQGTKYISPNNFKDGEFIFNLKRYLIMDTSNNMNFLCTQKASLNKKSLKNKVG